MRRHSLEALEQMIGADIKSLIDKLNPTARAVLAEASALAVSRSHYEIAAERFFQGPGEFLL